MADDERLLPLAQLAKRLPAVRGERPPARGTLYRWATVGLKSRAGQRIKLETEFVGGSLCSTLEAVRRLGAQKADQEWEPVNVISQRERAEMKKRAIAAMDEMRSWR